MVIVIAAAAVVPPDPGAWSDAWPVVLAIAAGAVLSWPPRPMRLPDPGNSSAGAGRRKPFARKGMAAVVGGLAVTAAAGPLPGIAAGTAAATALRLVSRQRARRAVRQELDSLLAALRMLTRELRSGAAPGGAAATVAGAVAGAPGRMLADLAVNARMGIERQLPAQPGLTGALARRLRSAMILSVRHGVPLADLVDTLCTDLADRVRTDNLRTAQIAGPRFSGYALAALPGLGLLLGSGMGADPLAVLFGPAPGGLLLPVGTALICGGLIWSARIVG